MKNKWLKMKKSLKGKTFLSRGGNGKLTKQQKKGIVVVLIVFYRVIVVTP